MNDMKRDPGRDMREKNLEFIGIRGRRGDGGQETGEASEGEERKKNNNK